jgi:hypothetical protein
MLLAFIAVVLASTLGCHAQMPLVAHSVVLTYQAPVVVTGGVWQTPCGTATGAAPCTYVLSRVTAGAVSAGCPVPSSSITYAPLNSSTPVTGLTYTDSSVLPGAVYCYLAQTVQNAVPSAASNLAGPFQIPANPGAPTLGNGTVSKLDMPEPALPQTTDNAVKTVAKLEGRVQ